MNAMLYLVYYDGSHISLLIVSILCLFSFWYLPCVNIFANISNIPTLNNINFMKRKDRVMMVLGCIDLDQVFKLDLSATMINESTSD